MLLKDMKINSEGVIVDINCREEVKKRLMDIGLIKGVRIRLAGVAPLGDPIMISLRGFNLAIRKFDAGRITVSL
ncbi:MAG: FeoA family protein [Christensenellales bacterium]|jgi:ferrous iron transport protein A